MDDVERPDWLTEMDEEILDVLSTDLTLSPSIIAENIDRSREGVSNRLNSLQAGGLVDKVGRGKYQLTDEGMEMDLKVNWNIIEPSEAEKIGSVREEVENRRAIRKEFGVSKEEYEEQIGEEYERIKSEEPSVDDPLEKAIERIEKRLRKEHSYFEEKKKRLREESDIVNRNDP